MPPANARNISGRLFAGAQNMAIESETTNVKAMIPTSATTGHANKAAPGKANKVSSVVRAQQSAVGP